MKKRDLNLHPSQTMKIEIAASTTAVNQCIDHANISIR